MRQFAENFARILLRTRWILLAGAMGLVVPGYFAAQRLGYDRSIENMFSPSDPIIHDLRRFENVFGQEQIVLVVYHDPQLLNPSGQGLQRNQQISERLSNVPGVADVLSISILDRMLQGLRTSFLDSSDPLAAEFRTMFAGYTHSADGRVAAAVCVLDREFTQRGNGMQNTLGALRRIAADLPADLADGVLVGEPVMVSDGFRYVEIDGRQLGRLSTVLLGLTLFVCLRSVRWVFIPLLIVGWSTIMTKAVIVWSGLHLSMVSSMLTAIITVVGVATVMHIAVGCRARLQRGLAPTEALHQTLAQLIVPVTWAILTDVAGFGALMVASASPIRDFGFMMALGSLLVLTGILLIVPALAIVGQRPAQQGAELAEGSVERGLRALMLLAERHPLRSLVLVSLAFVLGFVGMLVMRIETDFTRNFRASSPIARAYEFVEQRLGGAGVWDVMVPAPQKLSRDYLQQVEQFENALRRIRFPGRKEYALTKVLSFVDAIQAAEHRPLLSRLSPEMRANSIQVLMPGFVSTLQATDPRTQQSYLRIMLRAHDRRDAAYKQWLITEVTRMAREYFPPPQSAPLVTGSFVLLTNLVAGIVRDQWLCLAAALAGVGVAMAIAVRSLRLALVALLVNTLPVFVLLGAAGWIGIRMNMGAAMIGAVSMGLSVDSSLHYLYAFRRALDHEHSFAAALNEAQQTVGRALVYSTIALAVGFASLCASQFIPTVSFGALSALTLIGSLFSNLMVLPLLLTLTVGKNRQAIP